MRTRDTLAQRVPLILILCLGACQGDLEATSDARESTLEDTRVQEADASATQRHANRSHDALVELARFDARFDPLANAFVFEVAAPLGTSDRPGLRTAEQALYCPARVGVRPGTIRMRADSTTFGTTPEACGLPNAMPYSTLGVICSNVSLTAIDADFGEVFAEVTSMSPSTGFSGYNHPFGNGVAPEHMPLGSTAPSDQAGGLWRYESVLDGVTTETQWVFENAGGVFTFSGRLVARVFETEDGIDEDCDGVIDNGLSLFGAGAACEFDNDCESDVCVGGTCQTGECAIDTDEDGTFNCFETCVDDPEKTEPGQCGCGLADSDSDEDGTADCNDNCQDDPNKTEPGACGCGTPEGCAVCGNGILETGEFCDDGNTDDNDLCSNSCVNNSCGDGVVQLGAGEECDDGNSDTDDGCSNTCQTGCGDGIISGTIVTSLELRMHVDAIQDGSQFSLLVDDYVALTTPLQDTPVNTIDGQAPVRSFVVDDAQALALLNSGPRTITLRMGAWRFGNAAFYVDWIQLVINGSPLTLFDADGQAGSSAQGYAFDAENFLEVLRYDYSAETCDDGNTVSGDGCSSQCLSEGCGNGAIDAGEQCDDGNLLGADGCSSTCTLESCGNGALDPYEECDDNNGDDNDGCTALCKVPRCGNGIQESGELCDDANTVAGDGCSAACTTEVCGNGVVDVGESCDGGAGCTGSCEYATCLEGTDSDNDGLSDCAETNTGIFVSLESTGTDPFDADTDDDGISDGVELLVQPSGLDLRALGANPLRKSIFVETDWTTAPTCADIADFQPADWEIAIAREMFADAPVTNRDGSTGIDLIVDYGQGGLFTGGNSLGSDSNLEGGLAGDFLVYKANNLATARAPYFRYAILTATQNNGAGGLGETPGNDFNVTQGCLGPSVARIGAFLHELGHNLGLLHGGDDNCNFEPNYNSTMNYGSTGLDTNCDGVDDALPDFSSGTHVDLDESSLNEFAGLCGSAQVDFNASGTIESGYSANLNAHTNEAAFCGGTITVLDDHDDWGNLFFGGLTTSGDRVVAPSISICPPARPTAPGAR